MTEALPGNFIYEYLADGATIDMATTAGTYLYTVPDGYMVDLERVIVVISDTLVDMAKFGGLTELTNGCLFQVKNDAGTVIQTFGTDDHPIKKNADFAHLAGPDVPILDDAVDDFMIVRWTIAKAGASMRLGPNQTFNFVVQDALSDLSEMHIMIQGIKREV